MMERLYQWEALKAVSPQQLSKMDPMPASTQPSSPLTKSPRRTRSRTMSWWCRTNLEMRPTNSASALGSALLWVSLAKPASVQLSHFSQLIVPTTVKTTQSNLSPSAHSRLFSSLTYDRLCKSGCMMEPQTRFQSSSGWKSMMESIKERKRRTVSLPNMEL